MSHPLLANLDPYTAAQARAAARLLLKERRETAELERRLLTEQAQVAEEQMQQKSQQIQEAMRHPYTWVTEYTETYDEHWRINGRSSPYGPFPKSPYFEPLFDVFLSEPVIFCEKSRTMMLSWACVAYFLWEAMRTPMCGVLFQCQKEKKSVQLIDYAKCLWERQPPFLREAFPLARPIQKHAALELELANGSYLQGLAGGADQIRSYHPWGYLLDEASFVTEAGECYEESISSVRGRIILNSSAGPGWFSDVRRDTFLEVEE